MTEEIITLTEVKRTSTETIYQIRINGMLEESYRDFETAEKIFNELLSSRKEYPQTKILKTETIIKNN